MSDDCALYRDVLYSRELLDKVARELELKAGTETDAARSRWCAERAMRMRRRLYEGTPRDYDPMPIRPPPRFDRPS